MCSPSYSPPSIFQLSCRLQEGETCSEELTETMLARARDPNGEGQRVFTLLDEQGAMAQARASDLLRKSGISSGLLMGIPISVKDLFDVQGQVTSAGSMVLKDAAPASSDATIVKRLRQEGAVIIGRTNMVEFAYSGIGLNPHYGTPSNPWDRATGRVPGGSSSGAGVSVTDGMAAAAIGTDTGGSVRIPSALVGLVGFKPTASRVPQAGTLPLSTSLDSIGPLGVSVDCCRIMDRVLSGGLAMGKAANASQVRLLVPSNRLLDGMDQHVSREFSSALTRLSASGVTIVEKNLAPVEELYGSINPFGSFSPPEAFAWHRVLLGKDGERYDPRVASRIRKGADMSAADYIELGVRRRRFMAAMAHELADFDALAMPTVPIVAPAIKPLQQSDDQYWATNSLLLRNPSLVNFLDGCAITLPVQQAGEAPVGFSLAQCGAADAALLGLAHTLETLLRQQAR
jgi:aspartyl-tRNA(Asn)/glutamyl-tRNA(Gln) amidotransferase subunit A